MRSRSPLTDWLENKINKKILIKKNEQEDLDEVILDLKLVEYRGARSEAIDDYTSANALLLHGNGSIKTNGHEVELPSSTFEIPLSGLNQVAAEKDSLSFETERAQYVLLLQ